MNAPTKIEVFEKAFEKLQRSLDELPEYKAEHVGSAIVQNYLKSAVKHLGSARRESAAKRFDQAWNQLVEASHCAGYVFGLLQNAWSNSPEQGMTVLLRKHGSVGGTNNAKRWKLPRELAAKALISAAPDGKWPSKAHFDLRYHEIVKSVKGFPDTDWQRRKLMERADIRATLPSTPKRRR